ncbi:hypothetical protein [Enterovibrio baiacu]|uniref:hypothetical protein n=1 Tax=Enterovibrio baiacu TaxID=2491023 RepID=UPI003D13E5C2
MKLLEPLAELERREEMLRQRVNALSVEKKKAFYAAQGENLKDPDTYASLNWLFIGGFHHIYLGKYTIFFIEFSILVFSIIGLFSGVHAVVYLLIALVLYELPQLFFSQKIARQHNYDMSVKLFNELCPNQRLK